MSSKYRCSKENNAGQEKKIVGMLAVTFGKKIKVVTWCTQ